MKYDFPPSPLAAVTAQADAPDLARTRRRREAAIDLAKIDRLPPHSIEAEQALLGCCLLEPANCLSTARARLGVGAAFYDFRHPTLWLALCALEDARIGIDSITLRQHLKDAGTLDEIGGLPYLHSLMDGTNPKFPPFAANLPFYLDIVVEKHLLRQAVAAFSEGIGTIYADEQKGDVETLFAKVEDTVRRLSDAYKGDSGERDIKDIVLGTMNIVENTMEHRGRGLQDPNTLPTPWEQLNKLTGGGLHKGELIVVAARPGMGKTSLAGDILLHTALTLKRKCKFYSLEMQAVPSIALRLICSRARCKYMDILQGFPSKDALHGLITHGSRIAASGLAIEDRSWNEAQIRADARRAVRAGCELIVVDYLQIVPPSDRKIAGDMLIRATLVSEAMKAMAKELNVPVVLLSQLSRDIEKHGRKGGDVDELFTRAPAMSDLRNSGTIEQDADAIFMLWKMPEPPQNADDWQTWTDYRAAKDPGFRPTMLRIAKQRNGPAELDVKLVFEKDSMTYHDYCGGTGRMSGAKKVLGREEL